MRLLPLLALAFCSLPLLRARAAAQEIDAVEPNEVTTATVITIRGSGFGSAKPRVFLSSPATGKKKFVLHVVSFSDTELRVVPGRVKAGAFDLVVLPKDAPPIVAPEGLLVRAPDIAYVRDPIASPTGWILIVGDYFGPKKGRVTVGGKRAKIVSWTGERIRVLVPKIPNGPVLITVKNPVGSGGNAASFVVVGSSVLLGKDSFRAKIDGVPYKPKPKHESGAVAGTGYALSTSAGSRSLNLQFHFDGATQPLPLYLSGTEQPFPASITYVETTEEGETVWVGGDGAGGIHLTIGTVQGNKVAGTFFGVLRSEGKPDRIVKDGEFVFAF